MRGPLDHVRNLTTAPTGRAAGYDAAKSTRENRGRWLDADADSLAPVSQLTPAVRHRLRNRARHEGINNSYVAGIVRTLVRDTVGTGPRLQMLTPDDGLNEGIEDLWRLWATSTDFALNMRVMAGTRYLGGECFGLFRDSKRLDRDGYPITLDVRLVEPDQVTDGTNGFFIRPTGDDGIVCDEDDEVIAYKILKRHPGDHRAYAASFNPDTIPAANVLQWFQPDRPGQLRGVTPLAPALDDLAQLRRFEKAILSGAEFRAAVTGFLESDLPPDQTEPVVTTDDFYDTTEIVRGMLLTLPYGTKASFPNDGPPPADLDPYIKSKLRKIGRAINMPFGKVAGDHSSYNYSSGRMDDAPYWGDRDVERQEMETKVFNRVFWKFCDFARFVLPALAAYQGKFWQLKHAWHYDARPSSDPEKDARGDGLNLTNGSDTLSAVAARDGTTARALLQQRRRDIDLYQEFGLPLPPWATGVQTKATLAAEPTGGPQSNPQEAPADA